MNKTAILNQITAIRVMLDCLEKEVQETVDEIEQPQEEKHATFGGV